MGNRLGRQLRPRRPRGRCSMAPLDAEAIVRRAMEIAADICVYTNRNIIAREALNYHDRFLAARNRLRARPLHRRAGRRQARRRHRAAQPLAAPAARRQAARGGDAEEHPDDRPDRRAARPRSRAASPSSPGAPFLKVEATKFTEVGYVGRDVEQIVRDLVEVAIVHDARAQTQGRRGARRSSRPRSACSTRWSARREPGDQGRRSAASCAPASSTTRRSRSNCRQVGGGMPMFEIPGMPGAQMGAISIGDIFGKLGGGPHQDATAHGGGSPRAS